MFKLFTNNRGNNSAHFDNYNYRYFRNNKSSGDVTLFGDLSKKTFSETIITNNRHLITTYYYYERQWTEYGNTRGPE
jgi:hypothetical protein